MLENPGKDPCIGNQSNRGNRLDAISLSRTAKSDYNPYTYYYLSIINLLALFTIKKNNCNNKNKSKWKVRTDL